MMLFHLPISYFCFCFSWYYNIIMCFVFGLLENQFWTKATIPMIWDILHLRFTRPIGKDHVSQINYCVEDFFF